MNTPERMNAIDWRTIEEKVPQPGPPPGYALSCRPVNYVELVQMEQETGDEELAWGEILQEFYRYRQPGFFAVPPPTSMRPERRAWLVGVAEYLSWSFGLAVPAWVEEPEFFLAEERDIASEALLSLGALMDMTAHRKERRARSHQIFSAECDCRGPRSECTLGHRAQIMSL